MQSHTLLELVDSFKTVVCLNDPILEANWDLLCKDTSRKNVQMACSMIAHCKTGRVDLYYSSLDYWRWRSLAIELFEEFASSAISKDGFNAVFDLICDAAEILHAFRFGDLRKLTQSLGVSNVDELVPSLKLLRNATNKGPGKEIQIIILASLVSLKHKTGELVSQLLSLESVTLWVQLCDTTSDMRREIAAKIIQELHCSGSGPAFQLSSEEKGKLRKALASNSEHNLTAHILQRLHSYSQSQSRQEGRDAIAFDDDQHVHILDVADALWNLKPPGPHLSGDEL